MFCRSLFVLLYFFFWSLCCLFPRRAICQCNTVDMILKISMCDLIMASMSSHSLSEQSFSFLHLLLILVNFSLLYLFMYIYMCLYALRIHVIYIVHLYDEQEQSFQDLMVNYNLCFITCLILVYNSVS